MFYKRATLVVISLVILLTSQLVTNQTIKAHGAQASRRDAQASRQAQGTQDRESGRGRLGDPRMVQDIRDSQSGKHGSPSPRRRVTTQAAVPSCPSSPFSPPEANDTHFIADCGGGLDTGCTFRNGGPLVITVKVTRVVGDVQKLKANGLISEMATVQMPAFDVDFFGGGGVFNPERDRVSFNGNVVPGEFLQGDNDVWRLNEFSVPIECVNFPSDPGPGGSVTPADNTVRIDIDTANSEEVWCTSIDWAAISIDVARPIVMAHGILSSGATWASQWVPKLNQLGIPNSNRLNMGNLDAIQNNAVKISNEVSNATQRWGVDKVNIVCHSKGGLDSRHFVESSDLVERVIQLGTPNAGSPLADVAQGILVIGLGLPGTIIVNALAGPAGYQLTQPYMAGYNFVHGSNPNVKYTALAGDYDPNCRGLNRINPFCRPIDRLLLAIAGRGDTIVPVTSVHALGYTENRVFNSSGSNGDAKHTSLTGSAGVYNSVSDRVEVFGTSSLLEASDPTPVSRTATVIGTMQQGQVLSRTIPIDQATPTFFSLMYPSGNLDMALISPSGQRFDATTVVGNPDVGREEGPIEGGIIEVYNFAAPEVGVWTLEISAPSVTEPSGTVTFAANGWLESPAITFAGTTQKASIHAGENLRLFGTLRNNGAPLTGASVAAKIALPDNTAGNVSLHDDGANGDATANDGIYTGDFTNTAQPGSYRIVFTANRAAAPGTPAFSREDFTLATVSRTASTITGPFRDFGVDTDGDGLFNNLTIEVGLNITAAGNYRVFGILTDSQGHTLDAGVSQALSAGANTVPLKFDGKTIFQRRVDGPYRLTVRLAEENNLDVLLVDERINAHQTAAYSFHSFQHSPISLTGGGSSTGIDTNGNGRFELLSVGVEVEILSSGFYQWSARIADSNGREIGFDASFAFFNAGTNTLSFIFDGSEIGRNGVDGPYFIRGLLVFGGGDSLVASNAFTTSPFLASQFEGFTADATPPTLQVSVSPSILSPPNHKMALITATISAQDNLDPNPTVELVSITANEPVKGRGDGNTDPDIDEAAFGTDDRTFLLRAERSGTGTGRIYTITYRARDAAGNTTTASATVTVPHD